MTNLPNGETFRKMKEWFGPNGEHWCKSSYYKISDASSTKEEIKQYIENNDKQDFAACFYGCAFLVDELHFSERGYYASKLRLMVNDCVPKRYRDTNDPEYCKVANFNDDPETEFTDISGVLDCLIERYPLQSTNEG